MSTLTDGSGGGGDSNKSAVAKDKDISMSTLIDGGGWRG